MAPATEVVNEPENVPLNGFVFGFGFLASASSSVAARVNPVTNTVIVSMKRGFFQNIVLVINDSNIGIIIKNDP